MTVTEPEGGRVDVCVEVEVGLAAAAAASFAPAPPANSVVEVDDFQFVTAASILRFVEGV